MFTFDAHLDLSMNAIEWNRDLTRPIGEIRERERDWNDKKDRGNGVVCLPEMRRGGIGICVATQIARYVKPSNKQFPGWHSPAQAWAMTQAQLAWYRAMEEARRDAADPRRASQLDAMVSLWTERSAAGRADRLHPVARRRGLDHHAEASRTLLSPTACARSARRTTAPARYARAPMRRAADTEGRDLLKEMDRLGMILDVTHLTDEAFWEALELFHGPVWASHQNCRALVPHQRQFTDEQIKHSSGAAASSARRSTPG